MDTRIKVMVVEDSGIIVQRLYTILSEIDFIKSIAHAKNGEEAITLLKLITTSLVILDIKLPILNGIEVLKHIKVHYPKTRVIMLTNYTNSQYKELCLSLGAEIFLDKSTEFEQILTVINSMDGKLTSNLNS
ncbi:MAG: response regulator transcription factor [Bacteroidia bacterium]|nr:response regulator transcription factor [Bacteroidia bacterium]